MTREEIAELLAQQAATQITVTPKQPLPPEMTVPPLPERGNMLERALPKVYDPLQQTQQAIGGAAFGMTGMGALADLAEARTPGEAMFAGAAVTPVGKIAGKGVKAAAKLGDLAATERGADRFRAGRAVCRPKADGQGQGVARQVSAIRRAVSAGRAAGFDCEAARSRQPRQVSGDGW